MLLTWNHFTCEQPTQIRVSALGMGTAWHILHEGLWLPQSSPKEIDKKAGIC